MLVTILVATFLIMSAISTTIIISACVISKHSEETLDSVMIAAQRDDIADRPVNAPITVIQQPVHVPLPQPIGKVVPN